MTAPADNGVPLAPGDIVAERFRLDAQLGRGGMGVVFAATNLVTERRVAIKWLIPSEREDASARARFVREARAAARIRHPHVVDVYDVIETGDGMFLVMELLEGESLAARLARGAMPVDEAIALLMPAMAAVAAAHERGVIHRDLKPENLFLARGVGEQAQIKVLDFGISKLVDGHDDVSLTSTGTTMGTPRYMPIEQLSGQRDIDGRVDVYAFGVILYLTLTGSLPFDGDSYGAIAIRVATHTPIPPTRIRPELPPLLEHVVLKALARDRTQRFASMGSMLKALEAVQRRPAADDATLPQPLLESVPVVEPRALPDVPKARWRWSMLGVGFAALLGVGFWIVRAQPHTPAPPTMAEPIAVEPVQRSDSPVAQSPAVPEAPPAATHSKADAGTALTPTLKKKPRSTASTPGAATDAPVLPPTVSEPVTAPPEPQQTKPAREPPHGSSHRAGEMELEHF